MKKTVRFAWLICLVLLVSALMFTACRGKNNNQEVTSDTTASTEESKQPSEGLTFLLNEDGKSCSISGIGTCTDTDVVIPDTYMGIPVTIIGDSAFQNYSSLKSITIPESVTSIGQWAFYRCSSLTSITIPKNVTSIDVSAFSGCESLTSVVIPNNVTVIGNWAFEDCGSLTSITIGNRVTAIGKSTFSGCRNLSSILVADGNSKYYSSGNCLIEKESGVLFLGCQTSMIPTDGSVTAIGSLAFSGCSGLTSITLPDSITRIENKAFYFCDNLTSVTIGNRVTHVGESAFFGCSSLAGITIPDSVTEIGYQAFYGCTSLAYNEYDNAYYLGNASNPYLCLIKSTSTDIASCTVHENTKVIGDYAFRGRDSLLNITIPDCVTHIGMSAFEGCSGLTSVTIPAGVTVIGKDAFAYCRSIGSIAIPNSVIGIDEDAFSYCSSLTSITFDGTVAQWNSVKKASDWDSRAGEYTIYCTDGTIAKDGTVIYN